MAWIELHQAIWTHRKTFELAARLDLDETYAAAHVIRFWTWALDNAPSGDVSDTSRRAIAYGSGWRGDADQFVDALIGAGWLDANLRIHDWDDYAGRLVERREANAERMRQARAARLSRREAPRAENVQRTCDERVPDVQGLPDRTGPDLTGPDRTGPPTQTLPATEREGLQRAGARGIDQDVIDRLSRLPLGLDAKAFHTAAETALVGLGFTCRREVMVDDRGDGHRGRVDLWAERGGHAIAFEFDRESPRQKSIAKLAPVENAARIVVLREPWDGRLPDGLDAVISPPSAVAHGPPARNGSTTTRRSGPVLNGRNGWAGCPAGCPTNHGGPGAAKFLGEDWLAVPSEQRPPWREYLAQHGRPDLADLPAPAPAQIES